MGESAQAHASAQAPAPANRSSVARAPLTKNARHSRVAALLAGRPVRSQQELGLLLADQGVHVTQATLSRDLGELGAFKVRTEDGGLVYALPDGSDRSTRSSSGAAHLARRLEELLLSAEAAGSTVVLRTPPGGAHLLASSIDAAELAEVAGTIAGDDTVLLVCRTLEARPADEVAVALSGHLLAAAEGLVRSGAEPAVETVGDRPPA
ncbi:MAG TPA: arginine repressor [Frankiaceae bacterium]|nr:arginine repressor [Frankiaceae bacterium]